uniref:Uncharacterized protein n=1 Tax=Thermofilum pendens TaxID=2269 RepID=A0A7C3SL05_THEPE
MARPGYMLSVSGRLRLVEELRRRGLYVRWHAFEFLLAHKGRIAGVLLLEPSRGGCTLYCRSCPADLVQRVRDALRAAGLDAELRVVEVRSP